MLPIPDHIVRFLAECGFTQTEILVLRHLLPGGASTLRELAGRAGKSTGVLDQATRKLIHKGIVQRSNVNGFAKFSVESMSALRSFVRERTRKQTEECQTRERDFERFLGTTDHTIARPDVRHLVGRGAMLEAYRELLDQGGELLHVRSSSPAKSNDDIHSFHEECERARRARGVFTRVIAEDIPKNRKLKSFDLFSFRTTLLAPHLAVTCCIEKLINADSICFLDFERNTACMIQSSALARAERHAFELLWGSLIAKEKASATPDAKTAHGMSASKEHRCPGLIVRSYCLLPYFCRELFKALHVIPSIQVHDRSAPVEHIQLLAKDRSGLIHDLTRCFAARNIHIDRFLVYAIPPSGTYAVYDFLFELHSKEESEYVLAELERVPNVIQVEKRGNWRNAGVSA